MADSIIVIDTSAIHAGRLGDVQAAIRAMVEFVATNEPHVIAYCVSLNGDGTRMTVVQVHPDSASMEFHLTAAAPVFQPFKGLIELLAVDVYGTPSDALMAQLRQKAHMLGNATVVVHESYAGFVRGGDG
jgi:hypothetical protein